MNKSKKWCARCSCLGPEPPYITEHWFCPVIGDMICEVCCRYDEDAYNGIRGSVSEEENPCKKINCEHYRE